MKKLQMIYILGDLHGEWNYLNPFINEHIRQSKTITKLKQEFELEIIFLQCGDFGFWPHYNLHCGFIGGKNNLWNQYGIRHQIDGIVDNHIKIYWCPGNHDNWDVLDELESLHDRNAHIEIMPYVYYMPFGNILTLLNGTNVMFCGGADSVDKNQRIAGDTWWPQEIITYKDMSKLPNPNSIRVDWIISHTCPTSFDLHKLNFNAKSKDPSHENLEYVLNNFRPSKWWFGHYHNYMSGTHKNCQWMLLDRIDNPTGKKWCHTVSITRC